MNDEATASAIARLEEERCRALVTHDYAALAELVADDVVHIHTTGMIDTKASYLAGVEHRLEFLTVKRLDLPVRRYGDVAIATGRLDQTIRVRATMQEVEMKIVTTQAWMLQNGKWRQNSFHASNLA
ncbi:MAG TPA: nuclear transport factor 2 family protein [Stellaceae bacterium]